MVRGLLFGICGAREPHTCRLKLQSDGWSPETIKGARPSPRGRLSQNPRAEVEETLYQARPPPLSLILQKQMPAAACIHCLAWSGDSPVCTRRGPCVRSSSSPGLGLCRAAGSLHRPALLLSVCSARNSLRSDAGRSGASSLMPVR
ncbi:photoreceptor disk component PRCD isoform X1 [Suricata suricatta]|uniref:photoreceptor disk component PRCD isoform X1 n=1 Tax=Suricata suricatta TaxID=37032 RepID=UPI001155E16E|nr:photoreceptor disk component PRCD isoform X1 [Suricata suricatta]